MRSHLILLGFRIYSQCSDGEDEQMLADLCGMDIAVSEWVERNARFQFKDL